MTRWPSLELRALKPAWQSSSRATRSGAHPQSSTRGACLSAGIGTLANAWLAAEAVCTMLWGIGLSQMNLIGAGAGLAHPARTDFRCDRGHCRSRPWPGIDSVICTSNRFPVRCWLCIFSTDTRQPVSPTARSRPCLAGVRPGGPETPHAGHQPVARSGHLSRATVHNGSASLLPIVIPSTSRRPSVLTAIATITLRSRKPGWPAGATSTSSAFGITATMCRLAVGTAAYRDCW